MSDEIPASNNLPVPIKIPEASYEPLRYIVGLSEVVFLQLAASLKAAKPQATQDRFINQVTSGGEGQDVRLWREIIEELFRLNDLRLRANLPIRDVANLIAFAVSSDKTKDTEIPKNQITLLRDRVATLLELHDPLTLTAKTSDLLTEHQHFFYSARLFSDMRPIFSSDAKSVDAVVVLHDLVIHYGDGEVHNDFHIALDDADIQALRELLDRAQEKSSTLRKMIKPTGVTFLETTD